MKRLQRLAGSLVLAALGALATPLGAQEQPNAPASPQDGPPPPATGRVEIQTEPPIRAALRALNAKTDIRVEGMPLHEFVAFLSRRYEIQFKLDRAALLAAGIDPTVRITARLEQRPLALALERILQPLGLRSRFADGIVTITAAQPGERRPDGNQPIQASILRTLRSKTDFQVEIMPLEKFARFLSLKYRIPFRLDPDALERVQVDASAPVSAKIEGKPLSAALRQILARYRLTYRVVGGSVVITDALPQRRRARDNMGKNAREIGALIQFAVPVRPNGRLVRGGQRPQFSSLLKPLIDAELLFVKKTCAPTKEELGQIRKDVESYADSEQPGTTSSASAFLEPGLVESVEKHLSGAKADGYRTELEKRSAFERETCVHNLVALLDRELCLSTAQRRTISAALLTHWEVGWSPMVELVAVEGTTLVPQIPDDLIEPHLESAQLEIWINLPKMGSLNWRFQSPDLSIMGVPVSDGEEE